MEEPRTPTIRALYDRQLTLIEAAQGQLDSNLSNDGTGQKTQTLAKALLDLSSGAQKLEAQLHPASKVQR
ncbi:MAG TPA: hypothetical protein VFX35_01280 [Solirubrobacterales bacterium]|nr:hypothetical protein [Solirubrobacterales bacterium]